MRGSYSLLSSSTRPAPIAVTLEFAKRPKKIHGCDRMSKFYVKRAIDCNICRTEYWEINTNLDSPKEAHYILSNGPCSCKRGE